MFSLSRASRRALFTSLLCVAPFMPSATAHAAASTLHVTFDGCTLRFVTVGGEGVLDGFTATASVNGGPAAALWSSLDDDVALENHVQVEFASGASLSVQWTLEDDDENVIDQATETFTVPPCDPPYQIRIDKVANGDAPAADVTVRVWPGLGDGGLDCGVVPPNDALVVTVPAAGGSQLVRVSVGQWCVAETETRGATQVAYASQGSTTEGGFHVADVAYAVNPGAPVVRVVTVTNTYGESEGTAAEFPRTGAATPWVAPLAVLLTVAGTSLVGMSLRRRA